MQTTGWLFDLYPLGDRMVLWFITAAGERLRLEDDFPYCIYLGGPQAQLKSLARALGQKGGYAAPIRPGARIYGPAGICRFWPSRSGVTASCPGCGSGWGRSPVRWPATTAIWTSPPYYLYSRRSGPAPGIWWRPKPGACSTSTPWRTPSHWSFRRRPWPP